MANYIPRLIAPSSADKDFIKTTHGGNNLCIEINNGYCLPNCVGYCWGRWLELLGSSHNLSKCNAEDWYNNTADGYKRGKTPRQGAIICWRKGRLWDESDGAGHVAVVEKVEKNGDIICSESVYAGARFRVRSYSKDTDYFLAQGYEFMGFIYCPATFSPDSKKYSAGTYTVKSPTLVVRSGAGKLYKKKKWSQLTENARNQIKALNGIEFDGYVKGMECDVTRVKGRWGKTPSGWISLDHCIKNS